MSSLEGQFFVQKLRPDLWRVYDRETDRWEYIVFGEDTAVTFSVPDLIVRHGVIAGKIAWARSPL